MMRLFAVIVVAAWASAAWAVPPAKSAATPPTSLSSLSSLSSPRRLASVTITGSPFPDIDVLAAAGLQIGASVTEEDFRHATDALGHTGAFLEVRYKYDFTPDTVNLQLEMQPAEQYTDVQFDNFVWFDEAELRRELKQRVPLFDGRVPVDGEMLDQLALAIDWVLNEHGVAGHAEYERTAKLGDTSGKAGPVVYTVQQVTIAVRHVDFPGASAEVLPKLQGAIAKWLQESYSRSATADMEQYTLPKTYSRLGYLNARFDPPVITVVPESAPTGADGEKILAGKTSVDIALPVREGRQYKLGTVTWTGNKAIPEDKLAAFLTLSAEKPLDEIELHSEIDRSEASYRQRGYMRATANVVRTLDESKGVANYMIAVEEGSLYRMGTLNVEGIDHKQAARVEELWALREGDVFSTKALEHLPTPTQIGLGENYEWAVRSELGFDDTLHNVDVTLYFDPKVKK